MKRVFFFIQILFLIALFSGGNRDIEAGNMKMSSLPSQARDQAYYSQLEQSGNRYTKDHVWLKNGDDHIQVGANGRTELHAPCAGVVKGINPMIENPYDMQPNQVWVYKCHLKRDQLGNLMSEQEYAQAIQ